MNDKQLFKRFVDREQGEFITVDYSEYESKLMKNRLFCSIDFRDDNQKSESKKSGLIGWLDGKPVKFSHRK